MNYNITQYDKDLLLQSEVKYCYKLLVINKEKTIVDELTSLQSVGAYCIDSSSKIRRTSSFKMYLGNLYSGHSIEDKLYEWIGYNFLLQIGIYSIREEQFKWYNCGYYIITDGNTSYNSIENSIETSLSDWYSKLNGTRNGQIGGAPIIEIKTKDEHGNPNTLKHVTEELLKSETDISDYIIDDIGEFYGMPQNNPNYLQYRKDNPSWNQLPYDLKYDVGCMIDDIFSEIKNLYPNCQMYFDIYNIFCFNMIPSCENHPISLDNNYIQSILASSETENVSYDIGSIKNVTEVFGTNYDVDWYSKTCTTSTNIYTVKLDLYDRYSYGKIAFVPNATNIDNMKIRINELDTIPIYYEFTTEYIKPKLLEKDKTYVLNIKKTNDGYVAYFLGQYQPHALCVLTNNLNDAKYTKSYFSKKYNCNEKNIILRLEEDSPFAVQKLGEILDVKYGEDFENIISDSVAIQNAIYLNRKTSSMNDTITITTIMIPFLDVNLKVEYKKQQEPEPHYYIITSINNDMDSKLSNIVMRRFYPLYYG